MLHHFEWDPDKARSNLIKHGVSFEQARGIFADPYLLSIPDDGHSNDEDREISMGIEPRGETLVVVHTARWHANEERTRIISARRANRQEEMLYYSRRVPR